MAEDLPSKQHQNDSLTESQSDGEPLKAISLADLDKVLHILRKEVPRDICVEGLVKNVTQWYKNKNTLAYHQIYAPFGDVRSGAWISVFNIPEISYQSVSFYCQDSQKSKLMDALVKSDLIKWGINGFFKFYSVSEKFLPIIDELVLRKGLEKVFSEKYDVFWMDKEQARNLNVQCPPGVKLGKLPLEFIDYLDQYWPHRFEGSKHYLRTLLECNYGLGVFLPSTDLPIAWAVVSQSLSIRMLFVLPNHRRQGYAQLLCSVIARKLGEMGVDPHGNVLVENHASRKMFQRLGFKTEDHCYYIRFRPKQA